MSILSWFGKRAREGSTWAGLAASIAGLGMVLPGVSDSGAQVVADAVATGGQTYASSGNWMGALVAAFGGIAALLKDRGGD